MSSVSRMSGSPWHVTALSTGEEGRIDKRRCKFFDKKTGNCTCRVTSKYMRHCIGSTRCDRYKEIENIESINSNIDLEPKKTYINIEQTNKKLKPVVHKVSAKRNIQVGDNVDIESLDGKIKKTFRMLDKNINGKYNEITYVCLGKNLNEKIRYKNNVYIIKNIERIKK